MLIDDGKPEQTDEELMEEYSALCGRWVEVLDELEPSGQAISAAISEIFGSLISDLPPEEAEQTIAALVGGIRVAVEQFHREDAEAKKH